MSEASASNRFALQSPFTGEFHNSQARFWAYKKARIKAWLAEWGSDYEECDIGDGRGRALTLKGWSAARKANDKASLIRESSRLALERLQRGSWPFLYWGHDGQQKPVRKTYKELVRLGAVPTTFWVDAEEAPMLVDPVSWLAAASGRSRDGIDELTSIVGRGHGFETVKPLRLFRKIIQIWCPPAGIVIDPFAGSGTTAHAVLELNSEAEANPDPDALDEADQRRFILIEQGRPERGDGYARSLTAERVRRVISGERVAKDGSRLEVEPLPGGFRFAKLMLKVDAEAVLALEREEMLDLLVTSHWDQNERGGAYLRRLPAGNSTYLFATSARGEGFFLVWSGPRNPSVLDRAAFRGIVEEARAGGLTAPYHVYARKALYLGPNVEFYQIPDRILEKLGFNETIQPYSDRPADESSPA